MESPQMFTALIEKNLDGDASRASDRSVVDKAEAFRVGRFAKELESDVSNVNGSVVKEEENLVMPAEIGSQCCDKVTKCSEFGEMNAVGNDGLEVLEVVTVQQSDLDGKVAKDAVEIQVATLVEEEQPPPLEEDVKVGVSNDDFLDNMQNVGHKDGSFAIGDIVWCMAKNKIWWPALICDPSDVPKQAAKKWDSEKNLVRHFGSKTTVWCPSSHLKHFLESFKEMSSQGKSKSFVGAIEKAAEEVGRRVKLEMTCSCISNEIRARLIGRNKEDFKPWYVSNGTVSRHFDSIRFLERVKNLARMSKVPDIVENVTTRSYIAAYCSYFGHCQMYLRHLRDTDGPNGKVTAEDGLVVPSENTKEGSDLVLENGHSLDSSMMEESSKFSSEGTIEKGIESRERKKSRYLSFPFVNPSETKSLQDLIDSGEAFGKCNLSSSKRLMGNSIRKVATPTSPGDLKDLKVSLAQLLTELRDTSRGYFYLNGNTILNSTFDFFCEFRRYAFSDGDSANNQNNEDGIYEKKELEDQDATPLSETRPAKKRKKSMIKKLEDLNVGSRRDQVKDMSLKACHGTPVADPVTKSWKRKEMAAANFETNKTDEFLDLNLNGGSPRSHEILSDKCKVTEDNSQPKKKKNELENGIIKAKPISLVVDLFMDPHSLAGLLESNVERHFGESSASSNADTTPISSLPANFNPANSELVKIPAQVALPPTEISSVNPSPAKTSSGLPDLNGNGLDPNSSGISPKQSFPPSMIPAPASHTAARVEELPISVIKSNLEMMTKMLEESGNNISPDIRAKLENDVQDLLKKITDMSGSSS